MCLLVKFAFHKTKDVRGAALCRSSLAFWGSFHAKRSDGEETSRLGNEGQMCVSSLMTLAICVC